MIGSKLSSFALLCGSIASAAPVQAGCEPGTQFTFALIADGYPKLSLNVGHIGANENALFWENPAETSGTPACIDNGRLIFQLPNYPVPNSAYYQSPGDAYGSKQLIATMDGQTTGNATFTIPHDTQALEIERTSALQEIYSCNATFYGEDKFALFVGVQDENGNPPEGCVRSQAVQNFNVPGGETPPP